MSLDRCRTCKNVCFCALRGNTVITECAEFVRMDTAPAFDWDLHELLKLHSLEERDQAAE